MKQVNQILVTGGAGYIGSHTVVELIAAGFGVTIVDTLERSEHRILDGIESITGTKVDFHKIDCLDKAAMEHLFSNAIKFRNAEKPEIKIAAGNENGQWVISVKDNGIGIDQQFFDKIFIIFRRLNTDEVKYPGTGVGLTMCKKIMELHNGTIWLESAVEKGSTFYFSLPENL